MAAPRNERKQTAQVARTERDASFRRTETTAGDVHEDGAAAMTNAWHVIVTDHHNDIVKPVITPEPLGACGVRQPDAPVVVSIARAVAPAVSTANRARFKSRARPLKIPAIKDIAQTVAPSRRCTISLALDRLDAASPQGTREQQRPELHVSAARALRQAPDDDVCARPRLPAHRADVQGTAIPLACLPPERMFPASALLVFASERKPETGAPVHEHGPKGPSRR